MKYIIKIIIATLFLIGGWYIISSNSNSGEQIPETEAPNTEEVLTIATSFYPLQFAIEQIVGDLGTVTNIGAGRDPHDYEPSVQDMVVLQQADLVILQGADFEPWGDGVTKQLKLTGVPVHIATADLILTENEDHEEYGDEHEETEIDDEENQAEEASTKLGQGEAHSELNPHTWLDPVLFSETVDHLTAVVMALNSENAESYEANAAKLQSELAGLSAQYENRLASCELNEVIASHEAFSYVADRYGFSIHYIAGISTQDTPSATTLANLREEAKEGVGAILLEKNSLTAYGETLARESGLKTLDIYPIVYVINADENYLTLMQKNLNAFANALKCNE